jgi:hypothetical protein
METTNSAQSGDVNTSTPVSTPTEPVVAEQLSREQTTALGWVDEDEASGAMNKEQGQQARREILGRDVPPVKDARTPEEKAFDTQFPAAKPEEFSFPRYDNDDLTPEQKAFDLGARKMLAAGGFTKQIGSHLATLADRFMTESHEWSPEKRELYQRSSMLQLENVYQGELKANLDLARNFVQEWDRRCPGVKAFLQESQLGDHPFVIGTIVNHCQNRATRGKRS